MKVKIELEFDELDIDGDNTIKDILFMLIVIPVGVQELMKKQGVLKLMIRQSLN